MRQKGREQEQLSMYAEYKHKEGHGGGGLDFLLTGTSHAVQQRKLRVRPLARSTIASAACEQTACDVSASDTVSSGV